MSSYKKYKKTIVVASAVCLLLLLVIFLAFSLFKQSAKMNSAQKSDAAVLPKGMKITAEGSLTIEGIICTGPAGPRLPYPIEVLHASTLYALRGGTKPGVENQPSSFQGKRARVQGVTEGQEVVVCMNGKPQRIPYLTVSEIQPL